MSSKEEILAKIRKNTGQKYDFPTWKINTLKYPDTLQQFIKASAITGGEAVLLEEGQDVNELIKQRYGNLPRIASNLPEITCATFNPDEVERPQELNGTDLAIVRGEIGVAENGCVWIPQTVKYKSIYFISEALVILLDRNNVVDTMEDAYARIKDIPYNFATFISGPSKTADIESALVKGAHGAREALVILT